MMRTECLPIGPVDQNKLEKSLSEDVSPDFTAEKYGSTVKQLLLECSLV